jgi:hypothetical protein
MKAKLSSLTAAAFLLAAGCSIPFAEQKSVHENACSATSDCPPGSACTAVDGANTCIATSYDLPGLTFEVQPAAGTGSSTSALLAGGPFSAHGTAGVIPFDLTLPSSVDVSPGRVFLPCGGDTPVPSKVTFFPVSGLAGLLEDVKYTAESSADDSGNHAFHVSVPPGLYDLYFEPSADAASLPGCAASPPIFIPRQSISKDTGFSVHASAPLQLTGTLQLSQKEDFTKWFLEVVEPYSGQTISEVVQPEQDGIALEVPISLRFDWTARAAFTPIIRLRPPAGSSKPVIHWRLDAVALQGQDGDKINVHLDVSGIDTQPRQVGGQVFHDTQAVAATVTIRSLSISGDHFTRYDTTLDTNEVGQFQTALPPGQYQVIARPQKTTLAVGQAIWTIVQDKDCFCGQELQVPAATTLAGSVVAPTGLPTDVQVRLTPSAKGKVAYLGTVTMVDDNPDVQPRPASAATQNGNFQVNVDAGYFDLSLVTPPGSGYPWLVRPRLLVAAPTTDSAPSPVVSLKPFQLQSPAVVMGRVEAADGTALKGATIRAWLAVTDPSDQSIEPSAVQIGEAMSDDTGAYVLRLPPSVKASN